MEYTPVKSDPVKDRNDSICSLISDNQTPVSIKSESSSADHESQLIGSFSGMKIQNRSFNDDFDDNAPSGLLLKFKRRLDSHTVEGSPCLHGAFKRLDVHPTPMKIEPVNFEPKEHITILPKKDETKLLVVFAASDEHDTGAHQENALRTASLCGENGCLRRTALMNNMKWLNTDHLPDPAIADLMRYSKHTKLV